ncbi:MAG: drug/metabolite transporter (DMT)-like permease [Oceanospirillaceae bacterium]|jgi:drug/metabolite transporter (DMT)-like permease
MQISTFYTRAKTFSHSSQFGIWIVVLAMLLFPSLDVLAKLLAKTLSPVQISFLRAICQALFFLLVMRTLPKFNYPFKLTINLLLCAVVMNTGIIFMVWGLIYLPVANAIALFFVEPLLLMLLSSIILKEKSSPLRYLLAFIGLVGAMVVIRPNWQLYGWPAILPICCALCFAIYLLIIRSTRSQVSTTQAQAYISLAGTVILGVVLYLGQDIDIPVLKWNSIVPSNYSLILWLGFFATLTHWLMGKAFTLNQANILAPFRYLEIISATALGYLIFNEVPDLMTWLGTIIILSSGLMLMRLERYEKL